MLLLLGLLLGGLVAAFVYRTFFSPNTAFEADRAFIYIKSDDTYPDVRAQLEPLLLDLEAFDAVAQRKQYASNLRAGRYPIEKGMSNNDIVNALRSRNTPVRVSFNNQETAADLAGRVAGQIEADSASLHAAFTDPDFLDSAGLSAHQVLLPYIPNTYELYWNTSAEAFRDRMLSEYQRFWTPERKQLAKAQGLTPQEVMTLASIVQKETAKTEERPRVAGVYLNRLNKGIPLQADPTVIYAIKRSTGNFDTIIKRVLYRDLELESPYNTYRNKGLPPGPIFMPDISSIQAVLKPEEHEYLFFVADVERFGYHKFAETLAQHNRNKAQYIRWIESQGIKR